MTREKPKAEQALLRNRWIAWTAIIALFAHRRPARCRVDSAAYAALRNDLIATCRSLAQVDGERRSFYTALEETVLPWLTPRVLARTDQEILCTLLRRCLEVERELTGRRWVLLRPSHVRLAATVAVGGIVLGLAWSLLAAGAPTVLDALRDMVDAARRTITYAEHVPKWWWLAGIVVAAAMYAVSRTARA